MADSKRSSPSLLARQLRLRLITGDESDVPRNLHNIVVSIHAIATFQALHDYLRPRVAGLLGPSSRLSGMFAALAASGFTGSTSRASNEESSQASKTVSGALETNPPPVAPGTVTRRRSQRLSAKANPSAANENPSGTDQIVADASASAKPSLQGEAAVVEPAPSDTVVDSELQADFSDDEDIDAEVYDEEVDPDISVADKTISLSVIEGRKLISFFLRRLIFVPQMVPRSKPKHQMEHVSPHRVPLFKMVQPRPRFVPPYLIKHLTLLL